MCLVSLFPSLINYRSFMVSRLPTAGPIRILHFPVSSRNHDIQNQMQPPITAEYSKNPSWVLPSTCQLTHYIMQHPQGLRHWIINVCPPKQRLKSSLNQWWQWNTINYRYCGLLHKVTQVHITKAYPILLSICTFCYSQETSNCQSPLKKNQHLKIWHIWSSM